MQNQQDGGQGRDPGQTRQQDKLDNNRGGADPTGGQAIDQGRGPGENIAPRPGEDMDEGNEGAGESGRDRQPGSIGQSAEQPAEGWQSEEDLARQNPD